MYRRFLTLLKFAGIASLLCGPLAVSGQVMNSSTYKMGSDSINFAGILSSSPTYGLEDTAGEVASGYGAAAAYSAFLGYQFMLNDVVAPTPPTSITADVLNSSAVELSWSGATDDYGIERYFIYRDGVKVADVAAFPRDYDDTGLSASTVYSYQISALDIAGNESALSSAVQVTTSAAPITSSGSGAVSGARTLLLNNLNITANDVNATLGFDLNLPRSTQIFWGTDAAYSTGHLNDDANLSHEFLLNNLKSGVDYHVKIVADDGYGNQKVFEGLTFRTLNVAISRAPTNVRLFKATAEVSDINLTWKLPDDPKVISTRVVRSETSYPSSPQDGKIVFESNGLSSAESVVDNDVKAGVKYYYAIFTRDLAGNFSSGVVAEAQILLPGQKPIPNLLDSLLPAGNVDSLIAKLETKDFLFIQSGDSLNVSGDAVTIQGDKNLTIALKYYRVPPVLKTIAVTLVTRGANPQKFTFILRANRDRTRYEATIAPLGVTKTYDLKIDIIDYKNQGLKTLSGEVNSVLPIAKFLNLDPKSVRVLGWSVLGLILVALGIFVGLRRRPRSLALALLIAGCLVWVMPSQALAAINPEINYQGRLLTSLGASVADGSYNMRFKLYTASSGGSPIYTETLVAGDRVPVTAGLFSTMIGAVTSLAGVNFNQTLYLSVEIGGTDNVTPVWDGEMSPRKTIGSVPSAFVADTLDNLDSTQFVRADQSSSVTGNFTVSGLASTTTFRLSGTGYSVTNCLQVDTTGLVTGTGSACGSGGSSGGNSKWATSTLSDITPNGGGGIMVFSSSTITALNLVRSTTTNATSTNLFSTNANITNLTVTSCTGCSGGSSASSTLLSDNNAFSGTNTFANLTSLANLLATGSSTLQNFTGLQSTTTNATTTSLFATRGVFTNLTSTNTITGSVSGNAGTATLLQNARLINGTSFNGGGDITITAASSTLLGDINAFTGTNAFSNLTSFANLLATASSTFQNFTGLLSTTTNATTTTLYVSSKFYGASLVNCANNTDKLLWNGGVFSCGTDSTGGGAGTDVNWTFFNNSGIRPATTTNQVLVGTNSTSSLAKFEVVGGAFLDNATSTNLYVSGLASTTNLNANTATIGTITVGSCIGCSGGSASTTLLSDNNAFSGTNTFANLTSLANLLATGSSTLQNFTSLQSTSTNATTTNFFATTASSTNLFASTAKFGSNGLFVTAGGFVGIGTSTPPSRLSIATSTVYTADKPDLLIGPNTLVSGSANGTLFGANTQAGFSGNLIELQVAGSSKFKVDSTGVLTTASNIQSGDSLYTGSGGHISINTGTDIYSNGQGVLQLTDFSTDTTFNRLQFGGTTSASPALGKGTQALFVQLADGTNGGYFAVGTSTPKWTAQFASSTRPQLTISDPSTLTNNHWSFRNAGGVFYLATSSASTFATSTVAALSIDTNGQFKIAATGTAALPAFTIGNNTNTGLSLGTDGGNSSLVLSANGSEVLRLRGDLVAAEFAGLVHVSDGNASAASFGFSNETNTGFYRAGTGIIGYALGGTEVSRMSTAGTGFGTTTPKWLLQLASSTRSQLTLSDGIAADNHWSFRNAGGNFYLATSSPTTFATSTRPAFAIAAGGLSGFVGIGTSTPPTNLSIGFDATTTTGGGNTDWGTLHIGNNDLISSSNSGTYIGVNSPSTFGGYLAELQVGGISTFRVRADGFVLANGGFVAGASQSIGFSGRSLFVSSSDNNMTLLGTSQTDFTGQLKFGGTTSSFPAIGKISQGLVFGLADGSNGGFFAIGTSTPKWSLQIASSTRSQLTLSDPSTLTNNHWSFRNAGGNFYLATSSPTTFATSTKSVFGIDTDGAITMGNGPAGAAALTISAGGVVTIAQPAAGGSLLVSGDATVNNLYLNGSSARFQGGAGITGNLLTDNGSGTIIIGAVSTGSTGDVVGIGTSTPRWQLQIASSTKSQLTLSDGIAGDTHWSFRNAGGNFYLATSSPTTFATSTVPAIAIDTTSNVTLGNNTLTVRASGQVGIKTAAPLTASALTIGQNAASTNSTNGVLMLGTTALSSPNSNGTYFGTNALSSFTGNFLDYQLNNTREFSIDSTGTITTAGGDTATIGAGKIALYKPSATATIGNSGDFGTGSNLIIEAGEGGLGANITFTTDNVTRATLSSFGLGIGTTTPQWGLQIASSTKSQLTLSDGSLTSNHWSFRNAGGNFYLATSSASTFATSSVSALTINSNGYLGIGSTTPGFPLSVSGDAYVTGALVTTGSINAVALTSTGSIQASNGVTASGDSGFINFGRSRMMSSADGLMELYNNGSTAFTRLSFGGTTSAFVGLGTSGQKLSVQLADGTNGGYFSVGTSTPQWTAQFASSTRPQLTLSDPSTLTNNHWSFRNAGGNFYLATSSPTTFATSSVSALSIDSTGTVTVGPLTSGLINGQTITSSANFTNSITAANNVYSGGNISLASGSSLYLGGATAGTQLKQISGDGTAVFENNAGTSFSRLQLGGTTSAFIGIGTSAQKLSVQLADGTNGGYFSVGTSTPQWTAQFASSTNSQLTLSDGIAGDTHWSFRNAGGVFYLATSSPSTFATSTVTALSIDTNGSLTTSGTINGQTISSAANFTGSIIAGGAVTTPSNGGFYFNARSRIVSSADGNLVLSNSGQTSFSSLQLGGTTSAFPALARVLQGVVVQLADGTNGGYFSVGTSTPQWTAQFASSTRPQLTLSDPSTLTNNHWSFRNAGGNFYLATSSPTTFATSTTPALSIVTGGVAGNIGIGTSTPPSRLTIATSTVYVADKPDVLIGPNTLVSGSAAGTLLGANTQAGFGGNFLDFQVNGTDYFKVDSTGGITVGSGGGSIISGNSLQMANSGFLIWAGRSNLSSSADGLITLSNAATNDFTRLNFGGTTSAFPAFLKSGDAITLNLADGTAGGRFAIGTTTPGLGWSFQVASATPYIAITDTDAGVGRKHLLLSNIDGVFRIGTSSDTMDSTSTAFSLDPGVPAQFGLGTSTPFAKFAVNPIAGDQNQLVVGSSTVTSFIIDPAGNVGINTSAPTEKLTVSGNLSLSGSATSTNIFVSGLASTTNFRTNVATIGTLTVGSCTGCGSGSGGGGNSKWATSTVDALAISPSNALRVGIGTTTPQWALQVASSTGAQFTLSDSSTLTNNHWSFRNAGGNFYLATSSPTTFATSTVPAFTLNTSGAVILGWGSLQSNFSSTAGFTFGGTSTPQILALDTINNRVQVGLGTGVSSPDLFVADTKNTAGDPTGVNGSIYYNSNSSKFRCFENSAWTDCTAGSSATGTPVAIFNGFTTPDTTGNAWFQPYTIEAVNDNFGQMVAVASSTSAKAGFYGTFQVPEAYNTNPLVCVIWTSSLTTGNVVWAFDYRSVGGNDTTSLDQTTFAESATSSVAVPSVANRRMKSCVPITAGNLTKGDTVEYYFYRDGTAAADNLAEGAQIHQVFLEYKK